mmetsp:Transcript_60018/g.173811  ORF Transcript_60018/g.173811 Transcript_60018/m.173811 type:complete len:236 (+) Transcript_60018:634-1341(+)
MMDRLVEKKGDEIRFAVDLRESGIAQVNEVSPVISHPALAIVVAQGQVGPDIEASPVRLPPHVGQLTGAILAQGDVQAFHRKLRHGIGQHAPDHSAHRFVGQGAWAAEPLFPDGRKLPVDHGTERQRQPCLRVCQSEISRPAPPQAERQGPRVNGVMATKPRIEAEQLSQPHDRPLALERTAGENLLRVLPAIHASVAFPGVIHALVLGPPHFFHHALRGHVDVADHAFLRVVET